MSAIEKLSDVQRESLKKSSTDRLRLILLKAEFDEEIVLKMDRNSLMEQVAQVWLKPPDPPTLSDTERWAAELDLRKEELRLRQVEINLREEEKQRWLQERKDQKEKWEEEKALWKQQRKDELERWEMERAAERARWEHEMSLRKEKLQKLEDKQKADDSRQKTMTARLKNASDCLKHVLPKQPNDNFDLPLFFDNIESLFSNFAVDDDLQAKLLLPLLTNRARNILGRMPKDDLDDYGKVKKFLLTEYKLSPRQYRAKFFSATRQADETFQLFASRLASLFSYYTDSRDIDNSYEKLCQLLVADRLKECLSPGALQYVLSLEGDSWFEPAKVANLADVYTSNHGDGKYRGQNFVRESVKPSDVADHSPQVEGQIKVEGQSSHKVNPSGKLCYKCSSPFHLASACDKKRKWANNISNTPETAQNFRGRNGNKLNQRMQVNSCAVLPDSLANRISNDRMAEARPIEDQSCEPIVDAPSIECGFLTSSQSYVTTEEPRLKISPLSYVPVVINGERILALNDSGSQIPLIRRSVLKSCDPVGEVQVQGVVGPPVKTPIVALEVKLDRTDEHVSGFVNLEQTMNVVFAVTDDLAMHCDVILPTSVIEELKSLIVIDLIDSPIDDNVNVDNSGTVVSCDALILANNIVDHSNDEIVNGDSDNEITNLNLLDDGSSTVQHDSSDSTSVDNLAAEQRADVTLKQAFLDATNNRNGYFINRNILYHRDMINGENVSQLVLPLARRKKIFELAHSSIFAGHLRETKTKQRIKMSFFWPQMSSDIKRWNAECEACQLRARRRTTDRVPITPIARAALPFHTINIDVIGPIQDKAPYPWILTAVDSCTRWPSAFLLKSLTAKNACDALLQLFAQVGVASVIVCDRGTNFTSSLTREFLKRLGCCPRFLTPYHPEASGLVERYNATLKGILSQVVKDHPNSWHKLISLVVWAIREVPNVTTGISPYQMVYGRLPHGVLALLKDSWSGEIAIPPNLTKSSVEYLDNLKQKLELAAEYANEHSGVAQKRYADYYNLRAKDKTFSVGEKVIVLVPDSTNKVYSRWRVGTVERVLSKHSYLVNMGDGAVRHLHANHMRKFIAKVQSVVVVKHENDDKNFGKLCYPPSKLINGELLPSERITFDQIEHLTEVQRNELLYILNEFPDVFSDKPGLCNVLHHEIKTLPDFKPKAFKAYQIPEVMRQEVDRQIDQLLEWGFIIPCNSPMASPIVCALKKDGSLRLAINFVYLNKYTVFDAFPMPVAEDVMWQISQSRYISCFDASSGYWQVPMSPKNAWLTSFATHRGLFSWLRCPFGLKNSAASFVRMISIVLKPISNFAAAYVDDMGVHSMEWSLHMEHLVAYLTTMRNANLTLKLKKSTFAKPEIKMVGHYVGSGNYRPDPEKTLVLQHLEKPTDKTALRRALGMFSYFRSYVPDFARIARPLTDLTAKGAPSKIPWNTEQGKAFDTLCNAMCNMPVMAAPRFGEPFFLQTDASDAAVGCCLGQWDAERREHPIAYASMKLSQSQQNWSVVEKEAFAVIWALNKYKSIIFGAEVTVYVDHNPLVFLTETTPKTGKLCRWLLALQEFNVKFLYKKGVENRVADCLSRIA